MLEIAKYLTKMTKKITNDINKNIFKKDIDLT
jgi:hypothetical protein